MENVARPEGTKNSEKEVRVYFRCSSEFRKALKRHALDMDRDAEDICLEALRRYLTGAAAA